MSILDDFMNTALNKSAVDSIKDVVSSMQLIDFGVITRQYSDGTCDVTCAREVKSGGLRKYHGVEIMYPCGIKNAQTNQMCILINPLSSVYRTTDVQNPDFTCDHDQRCIKAIPVSNAVTDIFAGIDMSGNFNVSNEFNRIGLDKWSAYFCSNDDRTGIRLYQDGTIDINANNGLMHMLIHNSDGLAFIHYGSDMKALEALVMQPDGKKYNKFFCSTTFTFTNISDILNSELSWKRTEYTDLDGILHIYTETTSSGPDRHLATSEDLKALWTAFISHKHTCSGSGEPSSGPNGTMPANPKQVSGIIVKDGDNA